MATYVIIGGVAGGATAAARLRRMDESAEIIMIERGKYVSFANCGLPYHIGETISDRDALLVSTPEKLAEEFNIVVRTLQEVTDIDRAAHDVVVRDLETGESYRQHYDKLILSPGAKPFVPPIPGVDSDRVFTLRSIPDMDVIKAHVDSGAVRDAVIVGGGFIGLEMAENLVHRGVRVTVVEIMDQVMMPLDFEIAAHLHRHLRDKGVRLALGDGLAKIRETEAGQLECVLGSGRSALADMVIMAIGVRPESDLARQAELELGPKGHIVVDEYMRTSDSDIYAVGDAIQITNPVLNMPGAIPLAGPANRQARIAASHIAGESQGYPGTIGTSIAKVFDMAAASTGTNAKTLTAQGVCYASVIAESFNHVSYYPGATPLIVKLIYAPDSGKMLGAQVVGYDAVDRTIDALAVALQAGMTVYDLENLELSYAPPFGSAKSSVNLAGFIAANVLRGDTKMVEWCDIEGILASDEYGVLDVRSDLEWNLGRIPGSIHIPNTELRSRLAEIDRDKEWILICSTGRRSYIMERMLKQSGYKAANLSGGYKVWEVASAKQGNFDSWDTDEEAPMNATEQPTLSGANLEQVELDACGLQCPGPIMAVYRKMGALEEGQVLEVKASDPGFKRDIGAWCEQTGNTVLGIEDKGGVITAQVQKGTGKPILAASANGALPNAKTMVVFSGELDKALASFVIANGASAMGQHVTMFFTFWGLNILRRPQPVSVRKNLVEKMLGWMLPRGVNRLKLSQLHMAGIGTAMIKGVMKSKHIDSLPEMMRMAQENGVRMIACQMSMDMMGIKAEELIDGVEIGGVATYINETDKANASLFI